jgi:pyrimidine operon attenuation protein/uracil phosphoribosyltransferase
MPLPLPSKLIDNMVTEINQRFPVLDGSIVMVGIHTGGTWVAQQLFNQLKLPSELGQLDISFYRDDFSQKGLHPQVKSSELPDIEGKTIILVDDVIMSGRTIRAAMNELFVYGRPEKIILACLLDVGHRELPIQADIIGQKIDRPVNERIKLSGPEPLSLSTVTLDK